MNRSTGFLPVVWYLRIAHYRMVGYWWSLVFLLLDACKWVGQNGEMDLGGRSKWATVFSEETANEKKNVINYMIPVVFATKAERIL